MSSEENINSLPVNGHNHTTEDEIQQAEEAAQLTPPHLSCGSCAVCCRLLSIEVLHKPAGEWCTRATLGNDKGCCSIYESRPLACKMFRCLWLESQEHFTEESGLRLPPEAKPSKSNVMMVKQVHGAHKALFAMCNPGHEKAFLEWPIKEYLLNAAMNDDWAIVAGFGQELYSVHMGTFFPLMLNQALLINTGNLGMMMLEKGQVRIGVPQGVPTEAEKQRDAHISSILHPRHRH